MREDRSARRAGASARLSAAAVTARRTAAPVFTSPDSAVLRLRRMVG